MIASIVPLLKLPRSTSSFDYLVPPELESKLKIGHLVSVPFRQRRSVRGVVLDLKKKPFRKDMVLKPVKKIIAEMPVPSVKMRLVKWIAEYYYCSLGTAAKLIIRTTNS